MLTDEQRLAIRKAFASVYGDTETAICGVDEAVFLAGVAWGAADMRERAAKVCDTVMDDVSGADSYIGYGAELCRDAIRAIPLPGGEK